jgi:DNA-binding NarL/FixJ family response regulator
VSGGQPPEITVALADDHTLFREGIRGMLLTDPSITIVGEAADGDAAAELAVQCRPDILLLDVEMPGPGAPAIIRTVSQNCPGVRVVVLTMHDDADMVQELVNCGAAAYLVKSILRDELVAAIHSAVSRPDAVLVSVSRQTIESMDGSRQPKAQVLLTARETEVLELIAEAFSNAQIAVRLRITEATVKRHLTNVYAKLNAVSRVDAIRKGTEARLLRAGSSLSAVTVARAR